MAAAPYMKQYLNVYVYLLFLGYSTTITTLELNEIEFILCCKLPNNAR